MKKILEFIGKDNIALDMSDDELRPIARMVCENFAEDWDSMDDWRNLIDKGQELATPSITPRSEPWQGAANYKSNQMLASAIRFGDRASLEVLKEKNLVKTDIIGEDREGQKKDIAERIKIYENAHINYKMDDWREDHEGMLYCLSSYGTVFKKVYFDPMENKKVSSLIHYPNFAISQGTRKLKNARSFTEIHAYSLNQAHSFMEYGLWRECNIEVKAYNKQAGSNASEGADSAEENPCRYFEQHCFIDLDDDGYEEPYIVTVHEQSMNVVRIVADYGVEDVLIRNGDEILTLDKANTLGPIAYEQICSTASLVKINRAMDIVKYGFIRSIDGTFLDIGYFYLLAAMTMLRNTTTNQLIDAGTLSNLGGGFLSKEFRRKGGVTKFKPGEYKQTDIPAAQLQGSTLTLDRAEPSQVLFALNQMCAEEIREFSNTIDLTGIMQANTPATTALVAVQEQIMPTSAILSRVFRSQSKEFQMLAKLSKNFSNEDYMETVGEQADMEADYGNKSIKVSAQKKMSSDTQRMLEAQAALALMSPILQSGGNVIPIIKANLDLLDSIDSEQIYPEMTPEQMQQRSQLMQIQQRKEAQLMDLQIAKEMKAVEAFKQEQQAFLTEERRKTAKLEEEIRKLRSEVALNAARVEKERASAMKDSKEAEAQHIENELIKSGAMDIVEKAMSLEVPKVKDGD